MSEYLSDQLLRRLFMAVCACAVICAGLLWINRNSDAKAAGELLAVQDRYILAATEIDAMQPAAELQMRDLTVARDSVGSLERLPRSQVIADITNALPAGVLLKKIEIRERRVRVIGTSTDTRAITDFSQRLHGVQRVRDIRVVEAANDAEAFEMEMEIRSISQSTGEMQ